MKCVVCGKSIKKGDHAGFSPLHRGNCVNRWDNMSKAARIKALEKYDAER